MDNTKKLDWEYICGTGGVWGNITHRLKVPGGWLYRYREEHSVETGKHFPDKSVAISMQFVPDPWSVKGEK